MRQGFPIARKGEVVGLLGGSFDPAHDGHVHITRESLKRFGLTRVWWLVTPGNPLKAHGPAPIADRLVRARSLMQHPKVVVTDVEARLGTRYTAETLDALVALYPGTRFVWLMGADNLAQFHKWQRWRSIATTVPLGVIARPGDRISARMSVAAKVFADARLRPAHAKALGRSAAPAWCFVNVPMVATSSSAIRCHGDW